MPNWHVGSRRAYESEATYKQRRADAEADWDRRKAEIDKYESDVKAILATREHLPRKKRAA